MANLLNRMRNLTRKIQNLRMFVIRINTGLWDHAVGFQKRVPSSLLRGQWGRLLLVNLFLFWIGSAAHAGTFTVTNLADSGSGTLREAMGLASASQGASLITINVTGTVSLASVLPDITTSLSIVGPGPASLILSGNDHDRIFHILGPGVSVDFSGLTLTRGFGGSSGGAVLLENGDDTTALSLTNCVLTQNRAGEGNGGALSVSGSGAAGLVNLVDCTLGSNQALGNGGGIDSPGATINLFRCTLNNNLASGGGGGISVGAGFLTIENCTITGNEAQNDGAGINSDFGATCDVRSSTIVSNLAGITGGGLRTVSSGPTYLKNNIIAENVATNSGSDLSGSIDSLGHNLIGSSGGGSGYAVTDLVDTQALIAPLQDNGGPTLTHRLLAASPALDAGDNSGAPATDQRGFSRIVSANIDIGAFEMQASPPMIACPSDVSTNTDFNQCSAIETFTPSANGFPEPAVSCVPPSGTAFSVGTNTVTCSASNSAGTATCSFTVNINDTEPPAISCPAPIAASTDLGQCSRSNVVYTVILTDNCPGATVVCAPSSGSAFSTGVTQVSCLATDASGNINGCTFSVTINDTEPPAMNCPAPIVASTDPGQCSKTNVVYAVIPTDNCPGATVVCAPVSGSTFSKGVTTVSCLASDASGNTNGCTFSVTINDTEPPAISCPAAIIASTDPGQCTKTNVVYTVIPTDNCPGAMMVCTPVSGATFSKGVTTVNCLATDASGNTNGCAFPVTINDAEAPGITCPAPIVASTDPGQCSKSNVIYSVTPTDNCPGATVVCTPVSGATFSKGVTTVNCLATDASGNTNGCAFNVTINDTEPPGISCPAPIVASTDPGQCSKSNMIYSVTPTDNCPGAAVVCAPVSGSTFSKGVTTVSCLASDASGNTNGCAFNVTIDDTEPPALNCPAPIVASTDPGQCSRSNVIYSVTPTDNCPGATVVCAPVSGSTFSKGVTTVSCLASDASGNTNGCTFTVTINDTEAPGITCPAPIVANTDPGQCSKTNVVYAVIPTDNCPGATVVCAPVSGSTFSKGVTTVSCLASDASGNTSGCTFTVTISDTEPPAISCPAPIVASTDPSQCSKTNVVYTVIPTDNCPGATVVCTPGSGATFSKGVTTVSCVANDASGNTNGCAFSVTINDTEAPGITCPALIIASTDPGQCTKTNVVYSVIPTDNCPGATVVCTPGSGATFSKGLTTVNCLASDASGNTNGCTFTVTINDTEAPGITCPAPIVASTDPGQCSKTSVVYTVIPTDNCPGATVVCAPASGATFSKGVTTVNCLATDASGNTNGCAFPVTINDTEPPAISCSPNVTVECAGPSGTPVSFVTAFADNCPGASVVCVPPAGSTFTLGVSGVNCAATDLASNTSHCVFTVTVRDTTPPLIACPVDIIASEIPHDSGFGIVNYPPPVARDLCDNEIGVLCAPPSGSPFAVGYTTVTCTATDHSGNTNACTFTVRVIPYRLFVVTTPADSGPGTLRQAFLDANDAPGENRIEFHLPGAGPGKILILSPLPPITSPVIIDGWTQAGSAGPPLIEIDGSSSGGADGLVITAGSTTVRGLAIHAFATAIRLQGIGGNIIQGNYLGLDTTGTNAPGNFDDGLYISSAHNLVGGTLPGLGNLISGNGSNGIHLDTADALANIVQGNSIGTGVGGLVSLGNHQNGVFLSNEASRNTIGGVTNGTGNIIAFNRLSGVSLDTTAGVRNAILGNSLFSNLLLGIDLGSDGVTANDTNDADEGPNRLQNFPVLTDARSVDGITSVDGTLNSAGNATYRVEFFLNDFKDSSGSGEGQIFIGASTVVTPAGGMRNFSVSFPVTATFVQFVTATATDPAGNTSEFSPAVAVRTLPVLQMQPANTNAVAGQPVTLCASATGTPPFIWQWRLNGANILDATNPCYTIPAAQIANGGAYTVVVGNDLGARTTIPADLSLPLPRFNGADNFVDRVDLSGTNGSVAGFNRFATSEPGEPKHAGKPGGKSVWYTWEAEATGIVTIGTRGSTFDTLLAVYTGSSVSNLTVVASDEDRGGFYTSGFRFNAIDEHKYQIAIDGYYGAEGDFNLSWSEETTSHLLPFLTTQPQSQTVAPGARAVFTALGHRVCDQGDLDCTDLTHFEDGDLPVISYQWFFNGELIPLATASSLIMSNVQSSSVGDYTVQVTAKDDDFARVVESDAASLQINLIGSSVENAQSFDKFQDAVNAAPLILGTVAPVSISLASIPDSGLTPAAASVVRGFTGTQIFNTTSNASQGEIFCGVPGGASRWITLVAEKKGRLVVTTDGSSYDTLLAVFAASSNPAAPVLLGCDNNSGSNGLTSRMTVPVGAGSTNFIGVDGVRGASGILQLNFNLCPDAVMTSLGVSLAGLHQFQVNVRPGLPFTIQSSPDLIHWSTFLTSTVTTEVFQFFDPNVPAGASRFYRALLCP